MTFLSILKHVQVISSDSRQMRKNAQIADRQTDRQTDRPTDTQDRPIKVTTCDLQFFGYIHIDRKLLFSMLPSILTFNFCLILGSFLPFGALMG